MKKTIFCLGLMGLLPAISLFAQTNQDWLVHPTTAKARIYKSADEKDIILDNGLLKRSFRLRPNVACIDYQNLSNGQQLLRAIKPEARVTIDGKAYNIGGLYGQTENAYVLPRWLDAFTAHDADFRYDSYTVTDLQPFLNWKSGCWMPGENKELASETLAKSPGSAIPGSSKSSTGKTLVFTYKSNLPALLGISIQVHYELYDGIPLIIKWVSVENGSPHTITISKLVNEVLGLVEEESAVVGSPEQMKKQHGIYVETNYAFNNAMRYDISDQTTHWKTDSVYTSQVNYDYGTPCLLEVCPEKVTAVELAAGERFNSVRTHELLMDSYDRERRGLAIRQMYRIVAPWTKANPIFMHLVSKNDEQVVTAIAQCAATGYEAVILSFGSHCDMEDTSAANIARWKTLAAQAHEKGIRIGGYSLFSSRQISDEDDVIDPASGLPDKAAFFGHAPCLGSKWGLTYLDKLKYFITKTGFDIFENDGPYPGDVCASTKHPGHKGLNDSQWRQMELQKGMYHWCAENGVYVNAPDWYFLDGTNKIALGYREVNFSLPRDHQMILNRQNIYDGLWEKTPSMSWGFVPLTKYQGGGPEAVLEPLNEHLKDYEQLMMQYYGSGVQACYRGPRLFDTDLTRDRVSGVINWYKTHRNILNSDILHLRRADGRDWDGWMHVNPALKEKGLVMLFNPTSVKMVKSITLPLYYTGLDSVAKVRQSNGAVSQYRLDRNYAITVPVEIPAEGFVWMIIE